MAKRRLGASNDDIPECELVLAMALQNAGARGYQSMKLAFFNGNSRYDDKPIPGSTTTACCVRGALALEADSWEYDYAWAGAAGGNNAQEGTPAPNGDGRYLEAWRVGEAFELALAVSK